MQQLLEEQKKALENYNHQELIGLIKEPKEWDKTIKEPWNGQTRELSYKVLLSGEPMGDGVLVHIKIGMDGYKKTGKLQQLMEMETAKYMEG